MITFKQLETEVRRLATETPDFVYMTVINSDSGISRCFYQSKPEEGKVACIFGQALTNLGIELNDFHEQKGIDDVLSRLHVPLTEVQSRWCISVQHDQDKGVEWGKAVEIADSEEPSVGATIV